MKEQLKVDQQKFIINKLIAELSKSDPNLYYIDSHTIATLVYEKISSGDLSKQEEEIVVELKVKDILILMSYNSKCC